MDIVTSNRPYLIRALYEWLLDNQLTPHLLVDAEQTDVYVPQEFVEGGQIVLNLNPSAVRSLDLGNSRITFNARFGGVPQDIIVPPKAVLGIYARENGVGMLFQDEAYLEDEDPEPEPKPPTPRPTLTIVK
jgi:stringent starvation protein B